MAEKLDLRAYRDTQPVVLRKKFRPIVFASSSFYRRFARSLDASLHDSQPLDGWHGVRIIHPDVRL
jgi:hypothetical protein